MDHQIISQINDGTIVYLQLAKELKNIPSIANAALKKDINNIHYLPRSLFDNYDTILLAVQLKGSLLEKIHIESNLIQNFDIFKKPNYSNL